MVQPEYIGHDRHWCNAFAVRCAEAKGLGPVPAAQTRVDWNAHIAWCIHRGFPCADPVRNFASVDPELPDGARSVLVSNRSSGRGTANRQSESASGSRL